MSTLFNRVFGTSTPNITFPTFTRYTPGGTAPPPQMPRIDPNTLALWREHMTSALALFELTGIPTLYRWGKAIWTGRPYSEIEREYFEPFFRQLKAVGAAAQPPKLEAPPLPPAPPIPADYIFEKRRQPPTIIHVPDRLKNILAPEEDVKKELQKAGLVTSPEELAAQVAGRSLLLSLATVPGLAGMSRQALQRLAAEAAVGFGVAGTGAAATRTVQGYPEEALPAFFEVGLSSTVLADIANALRSLAKLPATQLSALRQQALALRGQRGGGVGGLTWRDPEGEAFVNEINDAIMRLKRGDTSKYDALVKQFEEWQKTVDEFNKLYELRQKGPLPPEDEARYTKLLKEVAKVRDRYETLKSYIDAAREMGIEAWGRQLEFEGRTLSDLARAAQEMPPGPVRDLLRRLQEMDLDHLLRLTKDPKLLSRFAKRFGVDEQVLAERATAVYRSRQWERLAQLPPDDLQRILTDREALRRLASDYGLPEDELMVRIEEFLRQRKLGAAQPKPQLAEQPKPPEATTPERPPIEPIKKETQFRPPETETEGGRGQVLIVRPKEEERIVVRRLEDLPSVEARLRYLLRRRGRPEPTHRPGLVEPETEPRFRQEPLWEPRQEPGAGPRQEPQQGPKTEPRQEPQQGPQQKPKTESSTEPKTESLEPRTESQTRVVTERELVQFVPYLPPQLLAMPVALALPAVARIISQVVGAPVALRLPPPPNGNMPLGTYLKMLRLPGMLGRQREVYVLI